MQFHEYEKLVTTISKEVQERYFPELKKIWKTEKHKENLYIIGVPFEKVREYPYRIQLELEGKNKILTVNLKYQVEQSIRMFPNIFYFIKEFLELKKIDCFIRTSSDITKEKIHKNEKVPLKFTGENSKRIYKLLYSMTKYIDESWLVCWTEINQIFFMTKKIDNHSWTLRFKENGTIQTGNKIIRNTTDIEQIFLPYNRKLQELELTEHKLRNIIYEMDKKAYYDPFSESMIIFQKKVPFELKINYDDDHQFFYYSFYFDGNMIYDENLEQLNKKLEKKLRRYIFQHRLRAVVEGRTGGLNFETKITHRR